MQYNKLIFGKDNTENIVNVTYDDGLLYVYTANEYGNPKVNCHISEYRPYVLTREAYDGSERLKGNKFYTYKTPVYDTPYEELYGRGIYKPRTPEEGYMLASGVTYFKGIKLENLSLLSFDIEATTLNPNDPNAAVVLISNTFRNRTGKITSILYDIHDYSSMEAMIEAWCNWVRSVDPDILLGHNIFSYDLPYLYAMAGDTLLLGRDKSDIKFNRKSSKFRKDGQQQYEYINAQINGREIVDTMFLSIKYDKARNFPSYGLKRIEKHLNLTNDSRIEWDFEKWPTSLVLKEYEKGNVKLWESFKDYARDDADSPVKMFDIMAPSLFYLNQSIPKKFQQMINEATGSQLDAFMIRAYLQDGWSQPLSTNKTSFQGAISMGIPGIYNNVRKVDVASLYPSIMRHYKVYPASKDPMKYFLSAIEYFTEERLKNKKLAKETGSSYYNALQEAQKEFINSAYGFMGANYVLYNEPDAADEVTRRGREVVKMGIEWATGHTLDHVLINQGKASEKYEWHLGNKISEGKGYKLVNVDTDSFSYTNDIAPSQIEFKQEIEELNSLYPKLIRYEDDGVFDKIIVIKTKNYVMQKDNKIKLKGSSIKDQKKEPALRALLEQSFNILLKDNFNIQELVTIYNNLCAEALNITNIDRWCTKKTVTRAVLEAKRKNELKILNAVQDESPQEGDKVWLYEATGDVLKLDKYFNNDTDGWHYVARVYDTIAILGNILDTSLFPRYHLKKHRPILENIINGQTQKSKRSS